jgi:hypothetical protein
MALFELGFIIQPYIQTTCLSEYSAGAYCPSTLKPTSVSATESNLFVSSISVHCQQIINTVADFILLKIRGQSIDLLQNKSINHPYSLNNL